MSTRLLMSLRAVEEAVRGTLNLALHACLKLLPIDLCSGFGAAMWRLTAWRYREHDTRARRNWKLLRPDDADPTSVNAAMRRLWRCVARTMAEYSVLDRLWSEGRIEVDGMSLIDDALATGRPVLIVAVHLGNWEVLWPTMSVHKHKSAVLYLPPENRIERRLVETVRNRFNNFGIPAGPVALRQAMRTLRGRERIFCIYVDEFARGRVHAPSFGRPIRADSNLVYAARLALATGAVIVPCFTLRQGDAARFKANILPLLPWHPSGNEAADIEDLSRELDRLFMPIITAHLDQWFYLFDLELPAHNSKNLVQNCEK